MFTDIVGENFKFDPAPWGVTREDKTASRVLELEEEVTTLEGRVEALERDMIKIVQEIHEIHVELLAENVAPAIHVSYGEVRRTEPGEWPVG